jgi:hypothetical protein
MNIRTRLILPIILAVHYLTLSPMPGAAFGQVNEELRQNPPAPLEVSRQEALPLFLDASQDKRRRYAAGLCLASPDQGESERLVAFASNPENDPDLRLLAFAVHRSPKGIAEPILKIVRDPIGERPEFVAEMVNLVSQWFFVNPTSNLARDGTLALRARLQDENEIVRIRALESLLSNNDPGAVEFATAQIRGTGRALVPDDMAISLLQRADARAHIALFKDRLDKELQVDQPRPQTLASLVTALAIDPDLQPGLMALISADGTDPVVKRAGLESLSFYHAKDFPDVALRLLNDAEESAAVREDAARYAMRFLNRGTEEEKQRYAIPYGESIKEVLESNLENLDPLKAELQTIQSSLYERFPEVEDRLK